MSKQNSTDAFDNAQRHGGKNGPHKKRPKHLGVGLERELGKRDVYPHDQEDSCKTSSTARQSTQRVTNQKQNPDQAVRAELIGSAVCGADGVTVRGFAPVLGLCRKLVEAGYDPERPLEVWRDRTLALRVRSIGEAAQLIINSKGTDFVCRPAVRRGSLVAEKSYHEDP